MRVFLLTFAFLTGCVTAGATTASPDNPAATSGTGPTAELPADDVVEIEAALRRYVAARAEQNWSALYEQSARYHRSLIVRVARTIGESGTDGARAQGFETVAAAEALSEEEYYVHNRAHLAASGQYLFGKTVTFAGLKPEGVVQVPYPEGRLRVRRFRVILSDGVTQGMGVTLENGLWHVLEN